MCPHDASAPRAKGGGLDPRASSTRSSHHNTPEEPADRNTPEEWGGSSAMPIVHQPSMRAEQSLRHGLQPDILVPYMACLTPRRCDAPSIASPSDAADCLPRHRVADRSCTAFVGDSRQRLRTQSEATVHQPALCGHKWFGHCGLRCCGGSPASRGCGARHPLSATPSNPSFAAAAKCAWQHVLTTAGANYSLPGGPTQSGTSALGETGAAATAAPRVRLAGAAAAPSVAAAAAVPLARWRLLMRIASCNQQRRAATGT